MQKLGKARLLGGDLEAELEAGFGSLKFWNSRKKQGLRKAQKS